MQFVENFVVLSWSVSLRVKKLWKFYLMMRSLQNFLRFYGIFSEVLKMNVARSGDTKIWFVPFIEKRGGTSPRVPLVLTPVPALVLQSVSFHQPKTYGRR